MQPPSSEIRKALKISVIDIGSNTIKLVNYNVKKDLSFQLFNKKV